MASFLDKLNALKASSTAKNTRSPLNDPFFAESLIIQSKSIVGRMYSSNEYVRYKYECELNKLIKEYRVWLAEIKRDERDVVERLETMRQEQRDIGKERREVDAVELVAKTNREFINHYKHRRKKTSIDAKYVHLNPPITPNDHGGQNKMAKLQKAVRLPKIVEKVVEEETDVTDGGRKMKKSPSVGLPSITKENDHPEQGDKQVRATISDFPQNGAKQRAVDDDAVFLASTRKQAEAEVVRERSANGAPRKPARVLSAPKSGRRRRDVVHVSFVARPSSVCGGDAVQHL